MPTLAAAAKPSPSAKRKASLERLGEEVNKVQKTNTKSFNARLSAHFDDHNFSDFTIACCTQTGADDRRRTDIIKEYKVHRVIICKHSDYFERCCKSGFAEAKTKRIELFDDYPPAVEIMIRYFYTCKYVDYSTDIVEKSKRLLHTYGLAKKYLITGLRDIAAAKIRYEFEKPELSGEPELMREVTKAAYDLPHGRMSMLRLWENQRSALGPKLTGEDFDWLAREVPEFLKDYASHMFMDKLRIASSSSG